MGRRDYSEMPDRRDGEREGVRVITSYGFMKATEIIKSSAIIWQETVEHVSNSRSNSLADNMRWVRI